MGKFNRDSRDGGAGRFGKRDFGGRSSFGGGRKFGDRDRDSGGRPPMHQATCDECGNSCQVPFRPTGDRPVFCSDCFSKQGGGSSSSRDGGSSGFRESRERRPSFGRDKEMFEAVCDKCGENCQVPFRPTEGKPVYCSKCFDKGGSAGGKNVDQFKDQFQMLNSKLDKILSVLLPGVSTKLSEVSVEKKPSKVTGKKEKSKDVDFKDEKEEVVVKTKIAVKKTATKKKK